jgi:hypothetical protein
MRLLLFIAIAIMGGTAVPLRGQGAFDPAGYTNGLGMRFVPVPGTQVLFSVYETRVKDFRAFVEETGYVHMRETEDDYSRMWSLDHDGEKQRGHSWEDPGFGQTGEHPVVGVSWYDAKAFCEWLTLRERAAGRLPSDREYRLPADHEWSVAVGISEDPARSLEEKDGEIKDAYPWGEWPEGKPPSQEAGNYAGTEADDGHWPEQLGGSRATTTAMPELPQWDRLSRTGSAFAIWEETSGSGVKMSIAPEKAAECCAARRGSSFFASLCSLRAASSIRPAIVTLASGFVVWLGRPLPSAGACLTLCSLGSSFIERLSLCRHRRNRHPSRAESCRRKHQ